MLDLNRKVRFDQSLERLKTQLYELAEFNETPEHGITRIVYTNRDLAAKHYVKEYMKEIGLEVSEDAIGNIFGKLPGNNSNLPPVWSGSHLDAPLNSGMFDGIVGVLGAIEALRLIKESGLKHERDLVAVIFVSEEPTRFGMGCLGSRAMTNQLSSEDLVKLKDKDGISLYEAMKRANYQPDKLEQVRIKQGEIGMFVELHIEQGPVLEASQKEIGIVDVIAAPTEVKLTIKGEQRHAGSTPMNLRQDPMAAAAELIVTLEAWAKNSTKTHTVFTVGDLKIYPGASNVIPGEVVLTIDSRDADGENKEKFMTLLNEAIPAVCAKRGVTYVLEVKTHDQPAQADRLITNTIKQVCEELKVEHQVLASGAYHDSMIMSKIVPFGMIFVPSRDGISHDAREWTDFKQVANGVQVLTNTLYQLANEGVGSNE
jgi:ureidoglycolate amidohydrolase